MNKLFCNYNSNKIYLMTVMSSIFIATYELQAITTRPVSANSSERTTAAKEKKVQHLLSIMRKQAKKQRKEEQKSFLSKMKNVWDKKVKNLKKYYKKNYETIETIAKYGTVSILSILCYKKFDDIVSWLVEPSSSYKNSINFTHEIALGTHSDVKWRGNELSLGNDQPIIRQLQATIQRGADCGYHALKNSFLVLLGITNTKDIVQEMQADVLPSEWENRFAYPSDTGVGTWRQIALKTPQNCNQSGDNIDGSILQKIIASEIGSPNGLLKDIGITPFSIVEDARMLGNLSDVNPSGEQEQNGASEIKKYFDEKNGEEAAFALLLNTGENLGDEKKVWASQNNHWISIIIHRTAEGKRSYTLIDSLSQDWLRKGSRLFSRLKDVVILIEQQVFAIEWAPEQVNPIEAEHIS